MFLGLGGTGAVEYEASNSTNIVLATVFGSDWAEDVEKVYTIPSGVTVGGTNTHALLVSSGMSGSLTIDVSGNVHGYGGAANGGTGGDAIHLDHTSNVTINLNSGGNILAGGGGGGQGGTGGTGGQGGTGGAGGSFGNSGSPGATGNTGYTGNTGSTGQAGTCRGGGSSCSFFTMLNWGAPQGGSGGSAGSAGSGGSAGGLAGEYIYNRASITFNNNGTVAGR